jgi:thioredoxin-related protein
MRRVLLKLFRNLLLACALAAVVAPSSACGTEAASSDALYVVDGYYPDHDPNADLARAKEQAAAHGKKILIVVGGDWCIWCEILDRFLARDEEAHAAFSEAFVILKVNMSQENQNREFLSQYRTPLGYPDFLILNANGEFLGAQNTDVLEQGPTYSSARMIAFAEHWRSQRR